MKKSASVTQKTIAQATGFSINTVSRALKDQPDISYETRAIIKKKARELGYIGNALASSMRSGLTSTIAVILTDIENPHFAILVKEIVEKLRGLGYTAFIMTTNEDEDLEYEAIRAAIGRQVDGIILCPTQKSTHNVEFLSASGTPFVLIGRYFDNYRTNYVVCNDKMGGYQATKHLLSLGHTKIMMLTGDACISSSRDRLQGYVAALEEAGLPVEERLMVHIPVLGRYGTSLQSLFQGELPFTAIIAFSDMLAWELMDYFTERGVSIPGDLSVIAFDDLQSRYQLPVQLSSVTSQKSKMSHMAAEILMDKILHPGKKDELQEVVLSTKVIHRASCGAPREGRLSIHF